MSESATWENLISSARFWSRRVALKAGALGQASRVRLDDQTSGTDPANSAGVAA